MADRNKTNNQQLTLTIASTAWRTSNGIAELILRFTVQYPKNIQPDDSTRIFGTAHGIAFDEHAVKDGPTIITVKIPVVSDTPRVEATVESGGLTALTSKDVPFVHPNDGVAIDQLWRIYTAEKGGVKVVMLEVGIQLTRSGKGIPGVAIATKVGNLDQQNLPTNSIGRAIGYFGPLSEDQWYDYIISSAIFSERKVPVFVPVQRPPLKFKFDDAPTDSKHFSVTCSVWNTETGEAVNRRRVTVRVGAKTHMTGKTTKGIVTLGGFEYSPNARLTHYTVYVEGCAPEKGNIENPRPRGNTTGKSKHTSEGFFGPFWNEMGKGKS